MSSREPSRPVSTDLDRVPVPRVFAGGVLMGLANLVPGVSGGTMILALGLYDHFIGAVARLTGLRVTPRLVVFFAVFGVGLAVAVLGGAKVAVTLVADHRWIMYSIFIGLTLGGVPEVARQCRPLAWTAFAGGAAGFALMAVMAFALDSTPLPQNLVTFCLVGALAASSMILPGVSGSTILLVLGFYEVVIGSLSSDVLRSDPVASLQVVGPVAVGAAVGIALLSHVLKYFLVHHKSGSHGFLMGLLLGSLLVIVPFQDPVHPELADRGRRKAIEMVVEGATAAEVVAERGVELAPEEVERIRAEYGGLSAGELKRRSMQLDYFSPTLLQVLSSLALVVVGFALTQAIAHLGGGPAPKGRDEPAPAA